MGGRDLRSAAGVLGRGGCGRERLAKSDNEVWRRWCSTWNMGRRRGSWGPHPRRCLFGRLDDRSDFSLAEPEMLIRMPG